MAPRAKLTYDQAKRMAKLREQGLSTQVIGARFGITDRTVNRYLKRLKEGETWKAVGI